MPTYTYECEKCKERFDHFKRVSEPDPEECPKCKSTEIKRIIGKGGGVIFKGSGFHCTDYGRNPSV